MSKNIKVVAATMNIVKLAAIKVAFEHYYENVQVRGYVVESKVPEQPIHEEVYKGAENRLKNLKEISEDYDFLVSCEAGLIEQCGHWFNVQFVLVESKDGKRRAGFSPGFEIPEKYVMQAIKTSVADVLDDVFDGAGGIRVLSKDMFTREKLIHDGTIMALSGFLNGEKW